MSPEIYARRLEAVKLANAVNKIEGVRVSSHAKTLSAKWARGEISGAEKKATLIAKHKKVKGFIMNDPYLSEGLNEGRGGFFKTH